VISPSSWVLPEGFSIELNFTQYISFSENVLTTFDINHANIAAIHSHSTTIAGLNTFVRNVPKFS
jgi:hypothetical protein